MALKPLKAVVPTLLFDKGRGPFVIASTRRDAGV